jgi:hypothetical protein
VPSEPPNRDRDERERTRLERLVPELVKRLVETGVEKLIDSPDTVRQWANDLRLPKELLSVILAHADDARSEIYKVLVREIRDFLERANLADEITRVLTGVTLEVKTQVRFVPNESKPGRLRPSAHATASVARTESDDDAARSAANEITEPEE